jgi:competence protein ComEA
MIEAEEPEDGAPVKLVVEAKRGLDPRWLVGAVAALVLVVAGAAIWATLPQGGMKFDLAAGPGLAPIATGLADATPVAAGLVIDVEGAVVDPGVHQVAAGGRVGDAIAAAATALNLAALVTDGQKIHVPARGEVATLPGGATDAPGGVSTGPIDINHASADELDTLPGIGPVTAAKIIAARPFATIDELDSRDVVGPSTLDKIRDLITITP